MKRHRSTDAGHDGSESYGVCQTCVASARADALDVPDAAKRPTEPESPLAWALVMVGAFTVTDDSEHLSTMVLGDINSVARRMADWLRQHPEMAEVDALDMEALRSLAKTGASLAHLDGMGVMVAHNGTLWQCEAERCVDARRLAWTPRVAAAKEAEDRAILAERQP